MERFFRYRDRWGNGLALWVVVLTLFTLPLLYQGVKHLRLENDVTRWLPENDPDAKILNWFYEEFEHDSSLLFAWDSSSLNDPRMGKLQQALLRKSNGRQEIPGVDDVTTPTEIIGLMLENGIDEQTSVDRLAGVLIGRGFLKVRLSPAGRDNFERTTELVRTMVERIVEQPVVVLPKVPDYRSSEAFRSSSQSPATPTDSSASRDEEGEESQKWIKFDMPAHDFQLRWPMISAESDSTRNAIQQLQTLQSNNPDESEPLVEDAFFRTGAPVAMSISLNEYGDDNLVETIAAVREAAVSVGIPEDEIRMGGSPIGRHSLNRFAARAVWNRSVPLWNFYKRSPVLLSGLMGVLCSFLMLRSFRLSILVVLSSLYTCIAVLVLVPATGKSLNIVLVVLPDLLLVLTMSGAIHVANYWKYAASRKSPYPVATAVQMAWRPCLLASLTTAIGMASLMTAVLTPVREFGIYSSLGCLISIVVILLIFPSMLSLWPDRHLQQLAASDRDAAFWKRLAHRIVRKQRLVNMACLVAFFVSVCGLFWFRTETKVIRYFPPDSRVVQDYDYLEEGLAGIVSIETVVKFDQSAQKETNILQRMDLVRETEKRIEAHRWISGTISLADFRPQVNPPAEGASSRAKILYLRRAQRTSRAIFDDENAPRQHFAKRVVDPLSVVSHDRIIDVATGDEIWRIRSQADVMGDVSYAILTADLNRIAAGAVLGQAGVDYIVTGMVPLFLRTQNAVLESLIESFLLAFAVIAVIMMVLLRHPVSGLLAMVPNLFPVGVVFGLVSWGGIPVDIGTMITASVALGIAIDGTLHLLTWFQEGIREGLSREDAVAKSLGHCGPAMWQTSVSISAGILMLSGADLLLIHRFGWLMAALIGVALLADVVLLPAMLGGWLGRIIESRTLRPETESASSEDATEVSTSPS